MERLQLGKRLKKARQAQRLTLKAIEAAAGISATHVSEIERGRTSPTLGALVRIAAALGKDPAYFLEREELADISSVTAEDRVSESLHDHSGTSAALTTSIPGSRLQARHHVLEPGRSYRAEAHAHEGEEAVLVLEGRLRAVLGGQSVVLEPGDTLHYSASVVHALSNPSDHERTSYLWFATDREID